MAGCRLDVPRNGSSVEMENQPILDRVRRTPPDTNHVHALRRHLVSLGVWSAVILLLSVSFGVWLAFQASTISRELQSAATLLPGLKEEILRNDASAASNTVDQLKSHTSTARELTTHPLWTVAGALPWVGNNVLAASEVATSADDVAQLGAGPLVSALQSLDWKSLTPDQDGVDLRGLTAAEPKIEAAAHAVGQSSDRLNAINSDDLLPQVAGPLTQAKEQLASLRSGLDAAANAANIIPEMMGSQSNRRYLLLIQNNAEARATGGIPGALAVLDMDKGKLSMSGQTSASAIGVFNPPLATDPEQTQLYSTRLGKYMQDVNLTPDFPAAASTARAMWEKKTGDKLDGVISLDPVALGYVLDATGPVQVTSPELYGVAEGALPTELSGANVVRTLLSDVYAKIEQPKVQDAYFAGVAGEIFSALSSGRGDAKSLIEGMTRGAAEGRILVWSGEADEQAVLAKYPLSGAIAGPSVEPAQFGVYFNDGTGAKMDYYVNRTVQLVEECTDNGYAQVKVRITSINTAPLDAPTSLPEYVTGGGTFGVPPGSVRTNVIAYGPVQAHVESALVDGIKTAFGAHQHSNRPVGSMTVTLAPGQSNTVEFVFGKIVQHTQPSLVVTPTVQPVKDVILGTESEKCVPGK